MSEVLICKSYWVQTGGINYCGDCGSGCLEGTHESNAKLAKNYKRVGITKEERLELAIWATLHEEIGMSSQRIALFIEDTKAGYFDKDHKTSKDECLKEWCDGQ